MKTIERSGRGPVERLGTGVRARLVDESGAARMDRIVLGIGAVTLVALLALSQTEEPGAPTGQTIGGTASSATASGGGATSAPARRTVSANGQIAPQPPGVPGQATGQTHSSRSYQDRFSTRPDNEMAILENLTDAARAADAEAAVAAAAAAAAAPPDPVLAADDPAGSSGEPAPVADGS